MIERIGPLDLQPASNLKGEAVGAAWTFLLPSLELDRITCLGSPAPAALATLVRLGARVAIEEPTPRRLRGLKRLVASRGWATVEAQATLEGSAQSDVDLVYVPRDVGRFMRSAERLDFVRQALRPGGHLYLEVRQVRPGARRALQRRLQAAGLLGRALWLTPAAGEARAAVPAEDGQLVRFFLRHGLYGPMLSGGLGRLERLAIRHLRVPAALGRTGVLASTDRSASSEAPPAYLCTLAAGEGVDLTRHRSALSARGRYNSRKVLLYLFPPGAPEPDIVVKTTRAPAFNGRLENAVHALRLAKERRLVEPGSAPEVVFDGHHGGLAMVGESLVAGTQLVRHLTGPRGASRVQAAFAWITDLGARSMERDATVTAGVAEAVDELVAAANATYGLESLPRRVLADIAEDLGRAGSELPSVFAHGDASVWNALLTPADRVAFIDWEAAESRGMPLWDLFYFARSCSVAGARIRRLARRPSALVPRMLTDPVLGDATAEYCARLGLPPRLVPALFVTCWLHRALKEVPRLSRDRLQDGHYIGLLRASLEAWEEPALRRLGTFARSPL